MLISMLYLLAYAYLLKTMSLESCVVNLKAVF